MRSLIIRALCGLFIAALAYGCGKSAELPELSEVPEARRYLVDDARKGGGAALNALGAMYEHGDRVRKDASKAHLLYRLAAERGDVYGQYNWARVNDVEKASEAQLKNAAYWYERAAEAGDPDAQFNIGVLYMKGRGVEKSGARAFSWFLKAAEQGHLYARTNVAFMYSKGEGVARDPQQAVRWYESAAIGGDPGAQYSLAFKYLEGSAVQHDDKQAYIWFRLSDRWYAEETKEPLKQLRAKLTKQEVEEAEEHIRLWNLEHPRRVAGAE